MRSIICLTVGAMIFAHPAMAQETAPQETAPQETEAPENRARALSEEEAALSIPHYDEIKHSAERGRAIYFHDQAAWHASDRFNEDVGGDYPEGIRGYFVLPGQNGALTAVFYGEDSGKLVEYARYDVNGGHVLGGGMIAAPLPQVSAAGLRMIAARSVAIEYAQQEEYGLCSDTPPNFVMLPPDEAGRVSVYLLTSTRDPDSYPLGGHYRVDVGLDGKVASARAFMNTCFDAQFGSDTAPEGSLPEAVVVTHLMDDYPTEIHVFASFYVPIRLMVATVENRELWSLHRGAISHIGKIDGPDQD